MRQRPIKSTGFKPTPIAAHCPIPTVCPLPGAEGLDHVKRYLVPQDVITSPAQLVRHRFERHHAVGLGSLSLIEAADSNCPKTDPVMIQKLKNRRDTIDPFALAKRVEQKLERIYLMGNRCINPSPKPPQPSTQPLTPAERQALQEISELLGIKPHLATQKTPYRRVTS